jgi:hypothetical protein
VGKATWRPVAIGAVFAAALAANECGAIDAASRQDRQDKSVTQMLPFQAGATVIDLSANPDDFSPVANRIVTTAKEALAANQKVIIMLGEEHGKAAHVRLGEFVRQGFRRAGIANPVMALEQRYNLLELLLSRFFPEDVQADFRGHIAAALTALKDEDPSRYHHLQTLTHAAWSWSFSPAANLANFSAWLDEGADVRLIDMAITDEGFLDYNDRGTASLIDAGILTDVADKKYIHATSKEGVRLRNLRMAAQLRDILAQKNVVIFQAGFIHLVGDQREGYPYNDSLGGIFAAAASDNIRVISLIPGNHGFDFENILPTDARAPMNNPDTIVLRGENAMLHQQPSLGSFEEEIAALKSFARASNTPEASPRFDNASSYNALRGKFERELNKLIEAK